MMRTKKHTKQKQDDLVARIEKLRADCEAELDRLSEEGRPSSIPAPTIRLMWMAKGGGSVFEACLLASKGK